MALRSLLSYNFFDFSFFIRVGVEVDQFRGLAFRKILISR